MKKVLIITYYWPPAGGGGVQRWVKFVRYLKDFGWEPIVYTAEHAEYPILDDSLVEEIQMGTTVIKHTIREPYVIYKKLTGKAESDKIDANFLSQGKKLGWKDKLAVWIRGNVFIPDARFLWISPSVKFLTQYMKNNHVDAVISTGPPHSCHLIAYHIKKKFTLPWIVDYRDPWTQIDYFDDLALTKWARKKHENLEKKILNSCDIIVTVGKTMASDLLQLTTNRIETITNGFDESDRVGQDIEQDHFFSITYIGTLNDARNPEGLWKALSVLKSKGHPLISDIKIQLVGKPETVVREGVKKYNLENVVEFIGYVSHKQAIKYQNSSQVLLLIINRTSNNKSILTGKIFEYLASQRPILCIGPVDGDAAEILTKTGAGVVIDYDDTDGIINFLEQNYEKFISGIDTSNVSDIEIYSRRTLTAKYAGLLDELTQNK